MTKNADVFHQEKAEIFLEGLKATSYQQIDDTGARVNGDNHYTQILCNPYYAAYFTVPNKSRENILDVLLCGKEKTYCFNNEAFDLMETFNVSQIWTEKLSSVKNKIFSDEEIRRKLDCLLSVNGYKTAKKKVLEACAIAAYHQSTDIPVATFLLSDDARQFKQIAYNACWIHDGRNYKKLRPTVPYHKEKLEAFLDRYWDFYGELCEERICKTKENKEHLLKVLILPEIPLHNNAAELAARAKVRKRDVSLQTKTDDGTRANDTFMTIVQTAKKLSVSAYDYIFDRVSSTFEMISLAKLIREKSELS
ncbi:MAG: hypothetical protein NHB15_17165 [Methanosarcina barkeri]|nr:hypothetical protein [Methanosarcina sp. ERenArc_MAG2]